MMFKHSSALFRVLRVAILLLVGMVVSVAGVMPVRAVDVSASDTASLETAIAAINAVGVGTHTLTILQDITLTQTPTTINNTGSTVIVEGNGRTIDGVNTYNPLKFVEVNVEIKNLTITRGASVAGDSGGALTVSNGDLSLTNTNITNTQNFINGAVAYATAIYVLEGNVVFESGLIDNNHGLTSVVLVRDGNFTMNGGTISNNSATQGVGGVDLLNTTGDNDTLGIFTMNDGLIDNNSTGGCAQLECIGGWEFMPHAHL